MSNLNIVRDEKKHTVFVSKDSERVRFVLAAARVFRDEIKKTITLYTLSEPDKIGNRVWLAGVTIKYTDFIHTPSGWKRAVNCTDEEILNAVTD